MIVRALQIAAVCALLAFQAQATDAVRCNPIPGAEALWRNPQTRFIFAGELHGTREQPAIFADLVCAAAASGRPLVVAIEHPQDEQPALDAFMASRGGKAAVVTLIARGSWRGDQDGRESAAYLALVEYLRALKTQHRIARLVAMDPPKHDDPGMAANIRAATGKIRHALTLIFLGNTHAAKKPATPNIAPGAASFLPRAQTVSVLISDKGGAGWNCQRSCGVNRMAPSSARPRGLVFGPAWLPGFDATLSTGAFATASPPAAGTR